MLSHFLGPSVLEKLPHIEVTMTLENHHGASAALESW